MVFSSLIFLLFFLTALYVCYFIVPRRWRWLRNCVLLVFSLFFYRCGGADYLPLLLASILINYLGGLLAASERPALRKLGLWGAAALGLGLLGWFKYAGFAAENLAALGLPVEVPQIVLPIGISFFTFQAMSYVVDVYRDTVPPQTNILDFALYISLFPQLIAGPIVQYSDIAKELQHRKESMEGFLYGVKRFCYGMGKKVLIANTLGNVADQIWALEINQLGAALAWLGMISYTFQIYYDFSGYSDMAIGLGSMLGFHWKENFDYPYTSLSIQEFWRRWHISLSSWFKNYVYIPLGGNRKGQAKTCRNLLFVFLLTGIWHGANFTFIIWGLMYAVLLVAERLFLGRLLQKNPLKILNWAYTMFFVMTGWVFFRSDNLVVAKRYLGQLFSFGTSQYSVLSYLSMQVLLALFFGLLGAGFLQRAVKKTTKIFDSFALQMAVLAVSILWVIAGTYNPFIYFQF